MACFIPASFFLGSSGLPAKMSSKSWCVMSSELGQGLRIYDLGLRVCTRHGYEAICPEFRRTCAATLKMAQRGSTETQHLKKVDP